MGAPQSGMPSATASKAMSTVMGGRATTKGPGGIPPAAPPSESGNTETTPSVTVTLLEYEGTEAKGSGEPQETPAFFTALKSLESN